STEKLKNAFFVGDDIYVLEGDTLYKLGKCGFGRKKIIKGIPDMQLVYFKGDFFYLDDAENMHKVSEGKDKIVKTCIYEIHASKNGVVYINLDGEVALYKS
nr:hypothetical protein [Lachnospiraceae bacterium]